MMSRLSRLRHWIQQPTTLIGLSLVIGGIAGAATGALSGDMATTLLLSSLPSLLPDNSTARATASALIPPTVAALEKRADTQPPHT
ncbi:MULTISPECIES: hypothetical protein [unclassified Saccharibacter]|uniref:hypothetical protein n=1 Tax=unclassified Saccharibacter TaxID=2648722 RepID=UPI0013269A08|nr:MULTISPECIES: hypothetical protein [unclassified Saccharibacter]MXV35878.1 hypothetical protein [Saccharibacter sp. EH611]MXV57998.1 hypothetical protein [Saccharibacter sp. EH70]MXV66236.1 hypothetical protein [Saccharibacter sp. EH60]MXV66393.1 hypothetical protein [Saccharibacter sp. EH60]